MSNRKSLSPYGVRSHTNLTDYATICLWVAVATFATVAVGCTNPDQNGVKESQNEKDTVEASGQWCGTSSLSAFRIAEGEKARLLVNAKLLAYASKILADPDAPQGMKQDAANIIKDVQRDLANLEVSIESELHQLQKKPE